MGDSSTNETYKKNTKTNFGILKSLKGIKNSIKQRINPRSNNSSSIKTDNNDTKNESVPNTSRVKEIGNNNIEKYKIDKALLLKSNKNVVINPEITKGQLACVSSGMGGHAGAFINVAIGDTIYCGKLINLKDTRELKFYKFMNENAQQPFYGTFNQFIPQLHAIVPVEKKKEAFYCIALDNMKKDIDVFIDIKIGSYTAKNSGPLKTELHNKINTAQSFSRDIGSRVEGYSTPHNLERDRNGKPNIFQEKSVENFIKEKDIDNKLKKVFDFLKKENLDFVNNYIHSIFKDKLLHEKSPYSLPSVINRDRKIKKDRIKRINPFLLLNISLEDIYRDNNAIKIKILNDIELGLFNIINDYILPNYNSFINNGPCFSFTGSSVGIIFTGNADDKKPAEAIVKLFDFGHPETYGTGFSEDKNNNKKNIIEWAINDYSYGIINLYIMVYLNLLIYDKDIIGDYKTHVKDNEQLKNTYNSYFNNIDNPKIEVLYRLILKPMADKINDNSFIRFKKVFNILLYMIMDKTTYPKLVKNIKKSNLRPESNKNYYEEKKILINKLLSNIELQKYENKIRLLSYRELQTLSKMKETEKINEIAQLFEQSI